jgi:phosphoribosylformimino-5-aminoimidazole carboxamide ribotide isomerase
MILYPAIDIRGGCCVRLIQGDYNRETVFGQDPSQVAKRWVDEGAGWLHLVDLDGAKAGRPVNLEVIRKICNSVPVPCQLGGGIRSESDLDAVFEAGITRAIVGTRAIEDPERFARWCFAFPGKVALGLDVKNGRPAANGWLEEGGRSMEELIMDVSKLPLAGVIFTDISRDGTLTGCNIPATAELAAKLPHPVIASGGIRDQEEIRELSRRGVSGAILGRSLYEGTIRLHEALNLAQTGE